MTLGAKSRVGVVEDLEEAASHLDFVEEGIEVSKSDVRSSLDKVTNFKNVST